MKPQVLNIEHKPIDITKYGSLLKDHSEVLKKSKIYPKIDSTAWWNNKSFYRPLPESFDGREVWEAYTKFPSDQRCADSWAIVASDILCDKYTISTAGELNVTLSDIEIVACIGKEPYKKENGVLSCISLDFTDACQGYSIYDAWEYIYENGLSESNCFSLNKLKSSNYPSPYQLSFSEKQRVYGKKCMNVESEQLYCVNKKNGLPIARRTFFCDAIFNIIEDTLEKTIESIKYELIRFGPVAAGFIVYENFAYNYDGTTVYTHVEGKPLGGHYVSIMGWEKLPDGTECWICRNSYGTSWGLLGFFKIKIGIKEIMFEQNISACSAFIYEFKKDDKIIDGILFDGNKVDIRDMEKINKDLYNLRTIFDIDPTTFYPKKSLALIKEGKLYGSLEPLIKYPNELPNKLYYWAINFRDFKFIQQAVEEPQIHTDFHYFIFGFFVIVFMFMGFIKNSKYKKIF